jgi:hypothetical protein
MVLGSRLDTDIHRDKVQDSKSDPDISSGQGSRFYVLGLAEEFKLEFE